MTQSVAQPCRSCAHKCKRPAGPAFNSKACRQRSNWNLPDAIRLKFALKDALTALRKAHSEALFAACVKGEDILALSEDYTRKRKAIRKMDLDELKGV